MPVCFITQNPYSPKLRVAIEGVADFRGHWGLAQTSWEVQGLRGDGGGTETRLSMGKAELRIWLSIWGWPVH